jgi:chitinase
MRRSLRHAWSAAAILLVVGVVAVPFRPAFAANGAGATFTKLSDWGNGYEGKFTIVNNSSSSLTWQVEFDLPPGATISSFWDAQVVKTGNHVVATGTWNGTLAVGTSTSFGWIGAPGGITPSNCTLNGASCDAGSTGDTTPPTTPGTLTSPSKTTTSITLSWGASTDSGGSGLAGYNIYRNGSATPTHQTTGTSTTFTDTGLSPNTTYTYTVRARDGAGNLSNASNQISVTTNPIQPGGTRKVGYFTQWSVYARNFRVKDVDTTGMAAKLTHINYAFGNINEQGQCFMANATGQGDAWADYQMKYTAANSVNGTADTWDAPLAGSFNQLKQLKQKYPHLKVYISLGGWTWSKYFSNMALPQNRAAGVASCIDLYIKGNLPLIGGELQGGPGSAFGIFDGIDLDWEWPASEGNTGNVIRPEDKANFLALIQEFRSQLDAYGASVGRTYDLTAFLPADLAKIDAGINPAIFNHLTYATVQGYDFYGAWGPQTNHQSQLRNPAANPAPANQRYSIESAINKYLSLGVPASKLVVGVPAYGRGWTNVPNVNNGLYQNGSPAAGSFEQGVEDYDVIKNRPGTVFRDNTNGAVWKYDGSTFWSYDDPQLVQSKGQWVKTNGLGGLMIWSLDGDDGSLVSAMQTGLQ